MATTMNKLIEIRKIEYVDVSNGCCPDCAHDLFYPGPRGGCAINVKCAQCGSCFNYCGVLPTHRIEEVPGVYTPALRKLRTLP